MASKKPPTDPFVLKLFRLMFNTLGRLFPWYFGKLAYKLWLSPTRFPMPQREVIIADKAKASFIIANKQKVRVWTWGDEGPTILFIHGWSGRGTQVPAMIQPLLDAGYRIIGVDLPAHGQSDGKQANPITISQALENIVSKVDDLHAVITHSFGGMVFGYFYNHYKINPTKVILICPPANLHTPINHFIATLRLPKSVQKSLIKRIESFADNIYDLLSVEKNLQKVKEPVLVIHDRLDDVVPFADGKSVAEHAPHGRLFATENLGHRKVLYDDAVLQIILEFLEQS